MNNRPLVVMALVGLAVFVYLTGQRESAPPALPIAGPGAGVMPVGLGTIDPPPRRPGIPWVESAVYAAEGPFPIDLGRVPVGVYDPYNKVARGWGLDGEPKRITKRISPEEADRLREEALRLAPARGILDPGAPGVEAPVDFIGFPSLDIDDCCGGGANVPPDPELAVGPDHVIAVVNVAFAIYDKTGQVLAGPITFSSFFAGTPGCSSTAVFDPNVLYDEQADRFILGVDGNGTDYCVAATTGPDPLGTWNRYGFQTNFANAFFDYPHAGVGVEAIFMGSNQFGGNLPGGFEGRVFAMDRIALYSGGTLNVATHSTGSNGTPQPMNLHGNAQGNWPSAGPHYIMTEVFDGDRHSVWSWDDPFGANRFLLRGTLDLTDATGVAAGYPIDVPQLGSNAKLQANDWRGLDNEYRNGFIYMTNTIACNPGGGTVDCLRWAKIEPSAPAVIDAGVIASDDEYRTFPDLAVNQCEDVAFGYTKSSEALYPGVYAVGIEQGNLTAEEQLKAGEIDYSAFDRSPHRWGDYTGMTIDPDGERFWYLGEYSKDIGNPHGRWGNYVASFRFDGCVAPIPRLGATLLGMSLTRAACRNRTTGQTVTAQPEGNAWDCLASGLSVASGDQVLQIAQGIVEATAEPIGGQMIGARAQAVRCVNQADGQRVQALVGRADWSCTDLGLAAAPGSRVRQFLLSTAP